MSVGDAQTPHVENPSQDLSPQSVDGPMPTLGRYLHNPYTSERLVGLEVSMAHL